MVVRKTRTTSNGVSTATAASRRAAAALNENRASIKIFLAGRGRLCDSRPCVTPDSSLDYVFPGPVALRRARENPLTYTSPGWGKAAAASPKNGPACNPDDRFLDSEGVMNKKENGQSRAWLAGLALARPPTSRILSIQAARSNFLSDPEIWSVLLTESSR